MTIYTWMRNRDINDGTATLEISSGTIEIGTWGDFTDSEYNFFSQKCVLYPGELHPDISAFPWQRNNQSPFMLITQPGGGGGSGGGPSYNWKPGVDTFASLPLSGNSANDARLAMDTDILYSWDGTQWNLIANLSGGLLLPLDGGNASSTYTQTIDGGNAASSYTLVLDGGTA